MSASDPADFVAAERKRVRLEYQRRAREVSADLYAPWQPSSRFMLENRNRTAARLLHDSGVFPRAGAQCLEVGYGTVGWLSELIGWGLTESDLHGIELDPARARKAREILPAADLRTGDAVELPWDNNIFHLAVASTLFTSVLDDKVRRLMADEIVRVLAPGGALLWYDFAYDNPRNPNVRGIRRAEIRRLFPTLQGTIRKITLAPPLARLIAPRWWTLATFLEAFPPLRTHLIAVLIKARS
ncbi:MAG TPA: class I SAM-dependent methyltransferase [Pyrinomonadaceae bacterium]|nr:class I SAM-dependent methyltransferase [Pyrinomonadaceae bacterium]